MKIRKAEIRIEDQYPRLFITPADGPEFVAPGGKSFALAWGVAVLPPGMGGEKNIAFTDPDDEDSEMVEIEDSTREPVYVHLCREFRAAEMPPRKLDVPTAAEATAARWRANADGSLDRVK